MNIYRRELVQAGHAFRSKNALGVWESLAFHLRCDCCSPSNHVTCADASSMDQHGPKNRHGLKSQRLAQVHEDLAMVRVLGACSAGLQCWLQSGGLAFPA